jgi:alpha-tubulin suppressor-like RCC1 family protein
MRRVPLAAMAVAAMVWAPACSDTLVDHDASPTLLATGCTAGEVSCGGACFAEDATHCGGSCQVCQAAADPHAVPACVSHACGLACAPGWLRSGDACHRATAVTAGFVHSCALLDDGAVRCWGGNEHGQLGDGTTQDSAVPVTVQLPGPAQAVVAGFVHSCAVLAQDGSVYCWGDNTTGALGDGTNAQRSTPARVQGLPGPASLVAAGGGETGGAAANYYGHTCAVSSGGVWCWGSDDSGQLGDGASAPFPVGRTSPVPVSDLKAAPTALAVGDRHTCAIVSGAVWCWGAGGSWQLGNGGQTDLSRPVQAQGLQQGATALAAGAGHTCAVVSGVVQCWGANASGQAAGGDNAQVSVQRPAPVALPGSAPVALAAGDRHTCAVGAGGEVVCFGANDQAQLAAAQTPRGLFTVPLAAARAVAAGFDHTCALLADGGLACWGADDRGQLGMGAAGGAVAAPAVVSGN